jgi:hypothetical protein
LQDKALVFQGAGLRPDTHPPIAMQTVGAGGGKDHLRPGLNQRAGDQGKFAVITDRNADPPQRGVEQAPRAVYRACRETPHSSASKRVIITLS